MEIKRYGHLLKEKIIEKSPYTSRLISKEELYDGEILWSREEEDVVIPAKKEDDAGYDIYPNFKESYIMIPAHQTKMIPTNLRVWMPKGYFMRLMERGSTGTIGIGQRAGVIDQSYIGLIFVPITNLNDKPIIIIKEKYADQFIVNKEYVIRYPYEKAICQGVILPYPKFKSRTVDKSIIINRKTERGEGALGSSKK